MGIFIAFTPTFGVQSVVAFVAATLLKVNRIIAIAMTWVTNIFTIVPIYYVTCLIGKKVLRQTIEYEYLKNVEWRNWGSVWEFIMNNFYALWAGALIVGILAAGATFVVLYYMTRYYHLLREKRKLKGRIHQA